VRVGGGCHCGAVRFHFETTPAVTLLDCNCSICARTGYLHLIVPHAKFTLEVGQGNLTPYRFGSGAAAHLFCRTCGVKSFYQPRSHPDAYSVNFRCVDADHGLTATIIAFDGRNWEAARAGLSPSGT
jgi:hypothetical protein